MRLLTGKKYNVLCQNSCGSVLRWPGRVGTVLCFFFLLFLSSFASAQTATVSGDATVCQNGPQPTITFTWSGSGTAPFAFVYTINNGSELTISSPSGNTVAISVATSGIGTFVYRLIRATDAGNITIPGSGTATITINGPPTISAQPPSITTAIGCTASFNVGASGTGPFTYQWRRNGSIISGATNSIFTVSPATSGDAANYDVIVTNSCGNIIGPWRY